MPQPMYSSLLISIDHEQDSPAPCGPCIDTINGLLLFPAPSAPHLCCRCFAMISALYSVLIVFALSLMIPAMSMTSGKVKPRADPVPAPAEDS
jgi:hypothetical protein